ncbi:hypothetical protein HPB48_018638 [Haemaphysalis longicornis]|uniref:Uncharacterized protein n=1 Tax=Haemaphysalis longicornis TaxID=44386 RepID=A0A9J6GE68_HAELO|nr:hypothetical protein HPB48_018638 [Haemaphysalis longicornis]
MRWTLLSLATSPVQAAFLGPFAAAAHKTPRYTLPRLTRFTNNERLVNSAASPKKEHSAKESGDPLGKKMPGRPPKRASLVGLAGRSGYPPLLKPGAEMDYDAAIKSGDRGYIFHPNKGKPCICPVSAEKLSASSAAAAYQALAVSPLEQQALGMLGLGAAGRRGARRPPPVCHGPPPPQQPPTSGTCSREDWRCRWPPRAWRSSDAPRPDTTRSSASRRRDSTSAARGAL